MQRYLVAAPLSLHAGALLELTPEQALPRARSLRPVGGGVYEVRASVHFKAGETLGVDGVVPKALATALVSPDAAPAAPAAPAPAAAPAKAAATRKQPAPRASAPAAE